ncbi:hypothetical protein [Croceivirga radicis]|uniref:hypothetical protein n=1 Tax=Croceivirga radicis TaxID=1929488 RepID=UPI0012FEBB3C|nr:hypothetical protein [Croceivirga radicis]
MTTTFHLNAEDIPVRITVSSKSEIIPYCADGNGLRISSFIVKGSPLYVSE